MKQISIQDSSIVTVKGTVFINGEKIEIPKSMPTNSVVSDGENIYIGGYKYFKKEKKFKRTIWAFLQCYVF